MDKLAVVILNWNGRELLEEYLPSVIKYSILPEVSVYVVDNGSKDDSIDFLKKNFADVKIIKLDKNYGFAGGYNKGLEQIKAKYYVLLNSDVEVTDDWINPIISMLDSNDNIAACQPKIKSYINRKEFEYAGAAGGFIDKYGFAFCRGRLFNVFEVDNGQYNNSSEIFWATGACLFIRSELYHNVGGLDYDFFAHMEEIDLCWRLQSRGYKVIYEPKSEVFHLGGGTLNKTNPHKTFLNFRNNLYLLYKNLPGDILFKRIFTRMVLDGIAAIKFLLSFEFGNFWAVFRAHINFYISIQKFKSKRNVNLKEMKIDKHSTIYNGSIVRDFFFRKKKYFSDLSFKPFSQGF